MFSGRCVDLLSSLSVLEFQTRIEGKKHQHDLVLPSWRDEREIVIENVPKTSIMWGFENCFCLSLGFYLWSLGCGM